MKIGLTGATGFVGRHFIAVARNAGHEVIGFSRRPRPVAGLVEMRAWHPVREVDCSGLDAIVHLAGEPILGLWTKKKRARIRDSRVNDTCHLVAKLRSLPAPPRVLVSASGAAYYGDGGETELTESSPAGGGFIAEVARAWEDAARQADDFMRVVTIRTAMALGRDGAAAKSLRRVIGLGLGGPMGTGRQWAPWIHVTDLVRLYLWAVENQHVRGPLNAAAPGAVRNPELIGAIAKTLHRPAFLKVPAFLLRLLPGGFSDVFLHSQRLVPAAPLAGGFAFLHPALEAAARDVFATEIAK